VSGIEPLADLATGATFRDVYRRLGLNMRPSHATFKDGSIALEAGIFPRWKIGSPPTGWQRLHVDGRLRRAIAGDKNLGSSALKLRLPRCGWTSNCSASSARVRSPLIAAIATFALKAGVWFRRGRLGMVSPDSQATACLPSGRNSTYRPVQISEAGSDATHPAKTHR
jgi:hypothetical protein